MGEIRQIVEAGCETCLQVVGRTGGDRVAVLDLCLGQAFAHAAFDRFTRVDAGHQAAQHDVRAVIVEPRAVARCRRRRDFRSGDAQTSRQFAFERLQGRFVLRTRAGRAFDIERTVSQLQLGVRQRWQKVDGAANLRSEPFRRASRDLDVVRDRRIGKRPCDRARDTLTSINVGREARQAHGVFGQRYRRLVRRDRRRHDVGRRDRRTTAQLAGQGGICGLEVRTGQRRSVRRERAVGQADLTSRQAREDGECGLDLCLVAVRCSGREGQLVDDRRVRQCGAGSSLDGCARVRVGHRAGQRHGRAVIDRPGNVGLGDRRNDRARVQARIGRQLCRNRDGGFVVLARERRAACRDGRAGHRDGTARQARQDGQARTDAGTIVGRRAGRDPELVANLDARQGFGNVRRDGFTGLPVGREAGQGGGGAIVIDVRRVGVRAGRGQVAGRKGRTTAEVAVQNGDRAVERLRRAGRAAGGQSSVVERQPSVLQRRKNARQGLDLFAVTFGRAGRQFELVDDARAGQRLCDLRLDGFPCRGVGRVAGQAHGVAFEKNARRVRRPLGQRDARCGERGIARQRSCERGFHRFELGAGPRFAFDGQRAVQQRHLPLRQTGQNGECTLHLLLVAFRRTGGELQFVHDGRVRQGGAGGVLDGRTSRCVGREAGQTNGRAVIRGGRLVG